MKVFQHFGEWAEHCRDADPEDQYTDATAKRAEQFLDAFPDSTPRPDIGTGPDNSIDIHWKGAGFELIVNVPADPAQPIACYGDNGNRDHVIKIAIASNLVWWLEQRGAMEQRRTT